MKIGPIQEVWLQRLENNPDIQMESSLGYMDSMCYKACCLGEYLLTYYRENGWEISQLWRSKEDDMYLVDGDTEEVLKTSYEKLGLFSSNGAFGLSDDDDDDDEVGSDVMSLSDMNDNGWTWPEIAAWVRKHPELVFTKSL